MIGRKNEQWLSLLANSGTPLFVSVKPGTLMPEQEEMLRAAYARASVSQPAAVPIDWMDTTCPVCWQIGKKTVSFDWFDRIGIPNLQI